jgi:hypothetical protein
MTLPEHIDDPMPSRVLARVRAREVHESALVGLPSPEAAAATHPKKRDPLDRYYSKPWHVLALLEELRRMGVVLPAGGLLLEPFAGRELALARGLEASGFEVSTADIDAGAPVDWAGCAWERDWSELAARACGVVTNTPYNARVGGVRRTAAQAVDLMQSWGTPFVACLMRSSFAEACRDREHLVSGVGAPVLELDVGRVSFTGKKRSDSSTTAWFVWARPGPLRWSTWRKVSLTKAEREEYSKAWDKMAKGAA